MIDVRTYALFLVAALAVIAAPGPDILYVLSRSIAGGKRVGSISAFGIATGEVLHTGLAVLGLAALLQASTAAFLCVKLSVPSISCISEYGQSGSGTTWLFRVSGRRTIGKCSVKERSPTSSIRRRSSFMSRFSHSSSAQLVGIPSCN